MKFFYVFIGFWFLSCSLYSQEHRGQGLEKPDEKTTGQEKGKTTGDQSAKSSHAGLQNGANGVVYGKVIDSETGTNLEYANVVVFKVKDSSMVSGSITDNRGNFRIDKLPFGNFYLKIQFIGYAPQVITGIKLNPKSPEHNAGTIKFTATSTSIGEVVVAAEKKMVEFHLDKKVVNVDKNIAASGGTAVDVLKDVPSVTVDPDGNVSLRGNSNFTILVDGRPAPVTGSSKTAILEQIPASSIETIEIITNPSARYQAEGMTGIVNIRLKKKMSKGFNGMITIGGGLAEQIRGTEKYNGSVNLNYNFGKANVFFSYDGSSRNSISWGRSDRTNTLNDFTTNYKQKNSGLREGINHGMKTGVDLFINPSNAITASAAVNIRNHNHADTARIKVYDKNDVFMSYITESQDEGNYGLSQDYAMFYKKNFDRKDHALTSDISFSNSVGVENGSFTGVYYKPDTITVDTLSKPSKDKNSSDNINRNLSAQLDYVFPIDSAQRFETGYKYTNILLDQDYLFELFDNNSSLWLNDSRYSNHFVYTSQVHAGYLIYSRIFSKLTFQLGVRAEQTLTKADQKTTNINFNRDYFGLFPSAHFTYKFNEENDVQISYSRRINRPSMHDVNPFIEKFSSLQYRVGNPDLKPEYVNSYELGYTKTFMKRNTVNGSLFYKQVDDVIKRFSYLDTNEVTMTTIGNFSNSISYGFETTLDMAFLKLFKVSLNASCFNSIINGDTVKNENFTWMSRMTLSARLLKNFDIQVSGNYRGPMVMPQGESKPGWGVDLALKKEIFNEKASVSFRVSDVFNSQKWDMEMTGRGFYFHHIRKRESRNVYLTFTYKINEGIRQKGKKRQMEPGGGEEREME